MNMDNLIKWLTILANAGVLAGIIFLTLELRQNNEFLAAQGRAIRADHRQGAYLQIMENDELRRIFIKIGAWGMKSTNEGPLTPDEELVLRFFYAFVLNEWQSAWREYHAGLIEIEDVGPQGWQNDFTKLPGLFEHWQNAKYRYRPEFISWMEEYVVAR